MNNKDKSTSSTVNERTDQDKSKDRTEPPPGTDIVQLGSTWLSRALHPPGSPGESHAKRCYAYSSKVNALDALWREHDRRQAAMSVARDGDGVTTVYVIVGYKTDLESGFDNPEESGTVLGVCTSIEAAEAVRTKGYNEYYSFYNVQKRVYQEVTVTEWSGLGHSLSEGPDI